MHNNPNQPVPAPLRKVQVSAAAFAAKYRSKRECYNFLAVDVGVYLPSYGKSTEFRANEMAAVLETEHLRRQNFRTSPSAAVGVRLGCIVVVSFNATLIMPIPTTRQVLRHLDVQSGPVPVVEYVFGTAGLLAGSFRRGVCRSPCRTTCTAQSERLTRT